MRPPLARETLREPHQVRLSTSPPTLEELARLAHVGSAVYAALPPLQPALVATPPSRARQGRATAVGWHLRAAPGAAGVVRIADAAGVFDSVSVTTTQEGIASGAFRVLPTAAGWQEWSLSWQELETGTAAWVLPDRPLRALVVSGPASLEGRDVARALESTGVRVTLAQSLGRGLAIGDAPLGLPSEVGSFAPFDVVLVLGGVALSANQASSLIAFAEDGGGVLAAGAAAAALPIARTASSSSTRVSASTIEWATPAELPPLPAAEVEAMTIPFTPVGPTIRVAARTTDADILLMAPVGRGRMAALGLENTWVWGLQAGRGVELAAFWRGMTDWLAGGARAPFAVSLDPAAAAPGSVVSVTAARLDPAAPLPTSVSLTRPDGRAERLPLAWQGAVGYARFVTEKSGAFELGDAADSGLSPTAHGSDASGAPPSDAWARLALLADVSGGEAAPAGSLEQTLAGLPQANGIWPPSPLLWLALVVALVLAEWTTRRLRGLA